MTTQPTDPYDTIVPWSRQTLAREYVHTHTCPARYGYHPANRCVSAPSAKAIAAALAHLDRNPRDARGARRIFHDAVCVSGCGPDSDHADRTQTKKAAALRKFRTWETTR